MTIRNLLLLLIPVMLSLPLPSKAQQKSVQPLLGHRSVSILEVDGYRFKDLDRNGSLDAYEDWRLSPEARAKDLVARMTVEQKAGFMLISTT